MSNVHDYSTIDVLDTYGRTLDGRASIAQGVILGRDAEAESLARAIESGRSAMLVGPPRVGKTAVLGRLVQRVIGGQAPGLQGVRLYELSTGGLCADTSYTGELESKVRAIIQKVKKRTVLYVPDTWNLPTAGAYKGNPRGVYDLLRPGMEAGKLAIVGEMGADRWQRLCRDHPTLETDFVQVPVAETPEAETREVLRRIAEDGPSGVRFDLGAVDRLLVLARKFLPTQAFPGKGVDLLRKVATAVGRAKDAGPGTVVDPARVEQVFARESGLPLHMISPAVRVTYDEMCAFLSERVLGQPEAVTAVADVLALFKTGLRNPDRPAGVLLFVGPTGVGKTELAKATAEFLFGSADKLFRLDLSEYKDYHSFEKLIGDPKQQVPGLLTNHVRMNPFTTILLDEFEKGHSNLADLFLQVFDDGRLTDAFGMVVDFRHTLIILTSNVGSELRDPAGAIGFSEAAPEPGRAAAARFRRALEGTYRPEFLNRLDRVLVFQPLSREDMRRIAQREIGRLYKREGLLERDLLLEVDDGVLDLLLERGFDARYGARPLKRALDEILVLPLARALLSRPWRRFQLLRVARRGDGVVLDFEDTESSRRLLSFEQRTRVEDGEGGVVRLSLSDVDGRVRALSPRLEKLRSDAGIDRMRREIERITTRSARGQHWEDLLGTTGPLARRHRLLAEVSRFDELARRVEAVRDLVQASFREADDAVARDLVHEFVRLERHVQRAERELVRFGDREREGARVVVRAVGGKEGAHAWAGELAQMYAAWGKARGYGARLVEAEGRFEVEVEGLYAFGYLCGEQGGHRRIDPPEVRGGRRGETFLARVEVAPASTAREAPAAPPRDDDQPVRVYDLWRSRTVKDRRTGHSEGDPKKVLSGRIDGFLDACADGAGRETEAGESGEGEGLRAPAEVVREGG